MKYEYVKSLVSHIPFIEQSNSKYLYNHIIKNKPKHILELGFAHGVATCFMAAALDEYNEGIIVSVDLQNMKNYFHPSIEELLEKTNLSKYVNIVRMQTGYNWYLHDEIVSQTKNNICEPIFDLCILDGAKNWTIDSSAFFLVDKLLKNNGYIIFDDYNWTYSNADIKRNSTDGITHRALSNAELETPHIKDIFEYLVKQHPCYKEFTLLEGKNWAIAKKTNSETKSYTIQYYENYKDIIGMIFYKAKKIKKKIFNY